MLATNRLVTITAVGGSGKTRLAIAVGEAELPHRPGGVWFVDLTAVMSGADVPAAIATALGLVLTSAQPMEQLIEFLSARPALVILDIFRPSFRGVFRRFVVQNWSVLAIFVACLAAKDASRSHFTNVFAIRTPNRSFAAGTI